MGHTVVSFVGGQDSTLGRRELACHGAVAVFCTLFQTHHSLHCFFTTFIFTMAAIDRFTAANLETFQTYKDRVDGAFTIGDGEVSVFDCALFVVAFTLGETPEGVDHARSIVLGDDLGAHLLFGIMAMYPLEHASIQGYLDNVLARNGNEIAREFGERRNRRRHRGEGQAISRDAALAMGILAHFERDHSCSSMRISGMESCARMFKKE